MEAVNFIPAEGYILIKPKEAIKKTAAGIIIPDTATKEMPLSGTVVAICDPEFSQGIEIGHEVFLQRFRGQQIDLNGVAYICLEIKDGYLGRIPKER